MTTTAAISHATGTPRQTQPRLTLDFLLTKDVPALEALYQGARVPNLADVKGDLRGRMLATTVLRGRVAGAVRGLAASSAFPWRGKSFAPRGALAGDGINRVIRDRWRLYRFETFIGRSRAGDFDALQLDYDNRDNPFFIRPIKDEMRALSNDLWLGQAYLELRGTPRLVLYFALAR
jgi:hypothetical protein